METYLSKIKTLDEVKAEVSRLKSEGKRVVFTNGCFDLLHPGHARYLYAAGRLGDYLVVAVNSDTSVRAIKGEGRPVMPQEARMELLAAFGFVDAVILFHEADPLKVIESLVPDILVKGGDWPEDRIIGADVVKAAGGRVERIPYLKGYSTTDIIGRIKTL